METNNNNNQLVRINAQPTSVNIFDPKVFEMLQRYAKTYAYSDLVPDNYRVNGKNMTEARAIANCLIAFNIAIRQNADPLAIMQNMYLVYGRPLWSSAYLIGLVNSCGEYEQLRFKRKEKGMLGMVDYNERMGGGLQGKQFDGRKIMDVEYIAYTTRKGESVVLEGSSVSVRMAVLAGWYTKTGSQWPIFTEQMLQYRAAAFWIRVHAPHLALGMRTVEEYHDIQEATYTEVSESVEKEIDEQANTVELSMEEDSPKTAEGNDNNPAPKEVVDEETGEVTVVGDKEEEKPEPANEMVTSQDYMRRQKAKPAPNGASQARLPDF